MMFGLNLIKALKPCKFRYNRPLDDGVEHFGFIAQEVDSLLSHEKFGVIRINDAGTYGIAYTELIAPTIRAIQEIEERLKMLEERMDELEVGRP